MWQKKAKHLMRNMNKPFWRKSRRAWYLQVGKRQIRLAENKAEAWAKWHEIESVGATDHAKKSTAPTLKQICELFLEDRKNARSQGTWQWYTYHIAILLQELKGDTLAENVQIRDVSVMIHSKKDWKQNSKHNLARAIKTVFSWAKKNRLIEINPVEHLEKPAQVAREDYITPEQFTAIDQMLAEGPFKDLIYLAWDTGMRPQELVRVEARHWNSKDQIITIPASEAKGKRRPRFVYVATDRSAKILDCRSQQNPTGAVLRNTMGVPWCKNSLSNAFARLRAKGIDTHLGAFRKGYCTHALQNGVDPVTLSKLMGHSDLTMIMKVYAQVHQDKEFMLQSAMKAKGLSGSSSFPSDAGSS